MRAVFMGSDQFSVPVLEALLRAGPDVVVAGVVTSPDRPAGRGRQIRSNPVKSLAIEAGAAILQPERVRRREALAEIDALHPDVIVVASFGQILPQVLLDTPRLKCLNLHPSLLPRHRGPSPVPGTILSGDARTGTTLMLMSARMDAGPILDQVETDVRPDETAGELELRLAGLSAELLVRDLPRWTEGSIEPRPQREEDATYTSLLTKADGAIDWTHPAQTVARQVRAYNPWPAAFTSWRGRQLKILRAAPVPGNRDPGLVAWEAAGLTVGTGEGLLRADELQIAGGRPLSAAAFFQGHRAVEGDVLGA